MLTLFIAILQPNCVVVNELQRTRSGRISRPPQHRVKDYKLLRPSNYDSDHDNNLGYDDYEIPPVHFEGELSYS